MYYKDDSRIGTSMKTLFVLCLQNVADLLDQGVRGPFFESAQTLSLVAPLTFLVTPDGFLIDEFRHFKRHDFIVLPCANAVGWVAPVLSNADYAMTPAFALN